MICVFIYKTCAKFGCGYFQKLYSITSSTDMVLHSQYVLPAAKQRWVTCAVLLHSEAVLVCGDRAGNVHAYVLHVSCHDLLYFTVCVSDM